MPTTNEPETVKRFAITHRNDSNGQRRLTFAQQGRYTFETRLAAMAALSDLLVPGSLSRILSAQEVGTLRVDEIDCYAGHFDPVRYFV